MNDIAAGENDWEKHLRCAPKKINMKKTILAEGADSSTGQMSSGIRKLDFKSSPALNRIMLSHARLSQESIETPVRSNEDI